MAKLIALRPLPGLSPYEREIFRKISHNLRNNSEIMRNSIDEFQTLIGGYSIVMSDDELSERFEEISHGYIETASQGFTKAVFDSLGMDKSERELLWNEIFILGKEFHAKVIELSMKEEE